MNNNAMQPNDERQVLLIMLLAQVCSLHDSTPRTFVIHVLSLYERGVLEEESIQFLFDLNLVPRDWDVKKKEKEEESVEEQAQGQGKSGEQDANVDPSVLLRRRSKRVENIKRNLSEKVNFSSNGSTTSTTVSTGSSTWSVDSAPLSLSRYTREFMEIRLLSRGSFGNVYECVSLSDSTRYAVKKVTFNARDFNDAVIKQTTREVHAMARMNHNNVVRYYGAWLEPGWMTGSGVVGQGVVGEKDTSRKLIRDIHEMVVGDDGDDSMLKELYLGDPFSEEEDDIIEEEEDEEDDSTRRDFSYNNWGDESSFDWDRSEPAPAYMDSGRIKSGKSMDSGQPGNDRSGSPRSSPKVRGGKKKPARYEYQICLHIQMQLCTPITLADFIRNRPKSTPEQQLLLNAFAAFRQILLGLNHVHEKGIIHRDLKPGNIFVDKDGVFKIGDFGLSKLLDVGAGEDEGVGEEGVGHGERGSGNGSSNGSPKKNVPLLLAETMDTHTVGIGTASYCAPEQISGGKYDTAADVFSLGLILLELCTIFDSEHERAKAFHNCRRGVIDSKFERRYPDLAGLIRACTNDDHRKRPAVKEILQAEIFQGGEVSRAEVMVLEETLKRKDKDLVEKNERIRQLEMELAKMRADDLE